MGFVVFSMNDNEISSQNHNGNSGRFPVGSNFFETALSEDSLNFLHG